MQTILIYSIWHIFNMPFLSNIRSGLFSVDVVCFLLCHVRVQCQDVKLTEEERTMFIDLEPFMNPAPYTVPLVSSPLHSASGK